MCAGTIKACSLSTYCEGEYEASIYCTSCDGNGYREISGCPNKTHPNGSGQLKDGCPVCGGSYWVVTYDCHEEAFCDSCNEYKYNSRAETIICNTCEGTGITGTETKDCSHIRSRLCNSKPHYYCEYNGHSNYYGSSKTHNYYYCDTHKKYGDHDA